MHHVTDVGAGILMGLAALAIIVFVARATALGRAAARCTRSVRMTRVAVIAHAGKSLGGGLDEFREALESAGVEPVYWTEVPKSKYAPERVEKALAEGAETIFVWGGDGTVQRCVDVMAGTDARLAILPAGTANLFASNLGIPDDIAEAVAVGLHGREKRLDVGKMNGEHFAVMAGAGLDARMIRDTDGGPKDRFGKSAYIWAASKNLRVEPFKARIEVNGDLWYDDEASCLLVGNVGALFGGLEAFDDASPEDGQLELGVTHAESLGQWARTVARTAIGSRREVAVRAGDEGGAHRRRVRPQGARTSSTAASATRSSASRSR